MKLCFLDLILASSGPRGPAWNVLERKNMQVENKSSFTIYGEILWLKDLIPNWLVSEISCSHNFGVRGTDFEILVPKVIGHYWIPLFCPFTCHSTILGRMQKTCRSVEYSAVYRLEGSRRYPASLQQLWQQPRQLRQLWKLWQQLLFLKCCIHELSPWLCK